MTGKTKTRGSEDHEMRLLLIDDNADDRLLVKSLLSRARGRGYSFKIASAKSLQRGLEILSKNRTDLVLLDLRLPDSQGLETFLKINQAFGDVPVVIMSGLYDDGVAVEAVRRGAQDCMLKKEMTSDHLIRTLCFTMERARLTGELAQAKARLEKLALIDPVTELFNRRGLQEILSREILRARRKHSNLLVLLVGLDDFKRVNQTLGHAVGDIVLREVAAKFKACLRATDYVARVGGDEFLVLLPETRLGEGMRVAEKVRLAISATTIVLSATEEIRVTASLGLLNVALLNDSEEVGPSVDDLLSRSHQVLSKSKEAGRNRVSYDDQEIGTRNEEEDPAVRFAQAFRSIHLKTLIQPIFRLGDQVEIGYEFLSRSLLKGFEMPDEFFRASLEANMLTRMDHQCLKSCVTASSFFPRGVRRHVNLFPSTLINVPIEDLLEIFPANGQRASYCIEISEQQIIGDPAYLAESVNVLKKEGILIAIDDLGFGRSCLESLILLEPDLVKIDKRCVIGIAADGANVRSLKRLLGIAKSLGCEVVAEGIETLEDLQVLKDLGVKYGQGFFLGRPQGIPSQFTGSELLPCET